MGLRETLGKPCYKSCTTEQKSGMDDVYTHATKQLQIEATPELVAGFKAKMDFIRVRYKHNAKAVESCLRGMGAHPTLLELLTAAFVVNGGVLFKHGDRTDEEEEEDHELNRLMEEIQELTTKTQQEEEEALSVDQKPLVTKKES